MIVTDFAEGDHPLALPSPRTLERFITSAAAAIPLRGGVSVLLTSDSAIRKLNRKYRRKNKATDVLSFPAAIPQGKGRDEDRVAGDLAISVDTAARQALAMGHPLATELKVLILHGLLHLAGLNHETDTGTMAARELSLRRKLRLPGGLIERTVTTSKKSTLRANDTTGPSASGAKLRSVAARSVAARSVAASSAIPDRKIARKRPAKVKTR